MMKTIRTAARTLSLSRAFVAIVGALMASAVVSAQSSGTIRKNELERVSISEIPIRGYEALTSEDASGPIEPAYTYWAYIHEIRDVDTVSGTVDLGFEMFHNVGFRFYGIDGFEITRKGGRDDSHVERGYKCRDLMVKWLGSSESFPEKAIYHRFKEPIKVVVRSHKSDKYGGRWLFTVYKDGRNLNQYAARSGCAIVTTFGSDPAFYPRSTPVTPELD